MFSAAYQNIRNIKSRVVDQRKATIRRLKELYREGGIREVFRGVRDYYIHNVSDKTYQDKRVDNQYRWELISSHLKSEHTSLVDLGCADGYFVERAADRGLDVLGLEHNHNRVKRTANRLKSYSNIEIRQQTLAPDNIDKIPQSDVILFLTVQHHWVWQYGWSDAADMFRIVCDRANLVFYEPPGTEALKEDADLHPDDSKQYYEDVVRDLFGDSVTIVDSDIVAYKGNKRRDPLFVLDTSAYQYSDDT